ncbi:MAG: nitrate reductase [Chloroflexi bacterium HGW-Chloroflexi-10]|nr:MAG: nitrate reductase [Chloroflexi bacterium HGW-Chloroflexi-10]
MDKVDQPDHEQKVKRNNIFKRLGFFGTGFCVLFFLIVAVGAGFSVDHLSRSDPNFCASCHNMTGHVDSYLHSNHMDNVHLKVGVGCKDCHSDYKVQDEVSSLVNYISGNYQQPFEKIKVKDDMCLKCHISMEYQADSTDYLFRNPHRSHWDSLRCTSCHFSHAEQVDYCSSCHDNGGQRMTGSEITPRFDVLLKDETDIMEDSIKQ